MFLEFIGQNQLNQLVTEPTRENSILDLVLTPASNLVRNVYVRENFSTSDHKMIEFELYDQIKVFRKPKIYVRDISKSNFNKLNQVIFKNNLDLGILTKFTVEDKYDFLTKELLYLYNKYIPMRTLNKIIRKTYPKRIKELHKEKLRLFRVLKERKHDHELKLEYKIVSRNLKKQLKIHHNTKEEKIINKGGNSIHKFIRNRLTQDNNIPCLIDKENKFYFSNEEKCNVLGKEFQKNFQNKNINLSNYNRNIIPKTKFLDIDLSTSTVWDVLRSLPNRNSTSPDNIPYILLKYCADTLTKLITDIFRCIIDNGQIPSIWKSSFIIPLYKKGEKSDPKNYRPISLTCTLCRVLERIIAQQLTKFLEDNKFFNKNQFGFLKSRSTTTQLLSTMDDFYNAIQDGYSIDIIYIDFAKAFDTVPINILLDKLEKAGISGKIGDQLSQNYETLSGVPQGSVLGPLLFLIFINDLPNEIPENVGVKLYADDVKLYIAHKNGIERDQLNKALFKLEKWTEDNGLEISPNKCYVLYLGKNNMKKEYSIHGLKVQETECIRDLGVLIDSKISFNNHINMIIKNAYLKSFQIIRIIKSRDLNLLVNIYKTYIRSQLEYATEVWNPQMKYQIDKIEKIQKLFTKNIYKKCGLVKVPYEERLITCKLEKLIDRRKVADLSTAFKIIKGFTSLNSQKYFNLSNRSLRRPLLLRTKKYINRTKNNFFHRVVNNWNNLPNESFKLTDPKKFRSFIKQYFNDKVKY
uniref:Reverse transcriptase domain-containing protein n=1 Tax=Meloidogyne enterolobii TaxID=390850 RepID=A0A6V7YDD1_MELEN|nr:unnamed protein product [Meloidogyne enterolobii]CAD2209606.1 unnamed protein product [Meloidogyne enterolobii]